MRYLLLFLSITLGPALEAQSDLGVHFMRGVWQSNVTNPALLPDHRVTIALPGLHNQFSFENFSYNDLVSTRADGRSVLQIDKVLTLLQEENAIRESISIPTFSIAVRIGDNGMIMGGHTYRGQGFIQYPKELPSLIWQGNAQYIGEEISIGPDVMAHIFQEFYVGGAVPVGDFLVIGGKIKFLSGKSSLETSRTDLRLFTSDDIYQSTLFSDYQVNSTGIIDYEGFTASRFTLPNRPFSGFGGGNNGFAVDVGAVSTFGDVTISASALDLGGLVWKTDVENQILRGTYTYQGLDILEETLLDSITIGSVTDTLETIYDIQTTNANFTTVLPPRFYVSASFSISEKLRFGGLIYGELNRGNLLPAAAISLHFDASPYISFGGVYSARREQYLNLGIHTAMRLGPLQFVAATDNILTAFQPGDSQTAHIRIGLNLGFDYIGPDKESPWNREESFFR